MWSNKGKHFRKNSFFMDIMMWLNKGKHSKKSGFFNEIMMWLNKEKHPGKNRFFTEIVVRNLSLLCTILLILYYTSSIWLKKGYIIFSDIDFGAFDSDYIVRMLGLFNTKFSSTNFFNLSRLMYIAPLYLLSKLAANVPAFLLKALIMSSLLMAGIGMFKLCEQLLKAHFVKIANTYHFMGLIIPSVYYAINPWVAFRIQHVFLLPGYALYPWVIKYFIDLFRLSEVGRVPVENSEKKYIKLLIYKFKIKINRGLHKDIKTSIKLGVCIVLGSASIHFFFFYAITIIALSSAIMCYTWKISGNFRKSFKMFFKRNLILWVITYFMCAYWLNAYVVAITKTNIEPTNVNVVDTLSMFSRYSDIKGIIYLISYWWPMFNFSTSLDIYFWIGGGVFLALIIYIVFYRFSRHFDITLITITTLVMLALATGVDTPYLADLNVYVVTKVPVFGQIFRDPNKIVGLLVAFFSILISFSVDRVLFLLRREGYSRVTQVVFIILVLGMHFLYFRPFNNIFMNGYYASVQIPQEYLNLAGEHYTEDGKILWMPDMDNMTLSNGLANFKWNKIPNEALSDTLFKAGADFHIYTDPKKSIFKFEGNDSVLSYISSFLQNVVDTTGGQHLGEFISWLGYNEVGFHDDVLKQDERQQFNKNVLDAQKELEEYHTDDIFSLYKVKNAQQDTFKVNNNIFLTKGLYTSLYMLDNKEQFNIDTTKTGLLWGNEKRQDYKLTDNDVVVADDKISATVPFIPTKYYEAPFNSIDSADPYTGWAKSLMKASDWFWLIESNNLGDVDYDYDYGAGFGFTYSSIKLDIPSYRQAEYEKNVLMTMDDITDNFFTVDNPENFNITVFPKSLTNQDTVYGHSTKSATASNIWKVAKSKDMDIKNLGGKFIRIKTVVSGINAGSMHFKVRFFDDKGNFLKQSYISGSDTSADFTDSTMTCDTLVPSEAVKMRIDLLCEQSTVRDTYFWIHDFNMYNISDMVSPNTLEVPITNKSPSNTYRVLARTFKMPDGANVDITSGETVKHISLQNPTNKFIWDDLGVIESKDNKLLVKPEDGITVLNAFIVIPVEEYDAVWNTAEAKIKGSQADIALSSYDYKLKSDFQILDLANNRTFANTIQGSLSVMNNGTLTKDLDILKDDEFLFSYTGNTSNAITSVTIKGEDGSSNVLELSKVDTALDRNFADSYYDLNTKLNEYYLKEKKNQTNAWEVYRYYYKPIHLKKGRYSIEIKTVGNVKNLVNEASVHAMKSGEVTVDKSTPDNMFDSINMLVAPKEQDTVEKSVDSATGNRIFTNQATNSNLWFIYAYDKIPVKKGQLIAYKASVETSGLEDVHSKLLWTNSEGALQDSTIIETDARVDGFYKIVESPIDGFVVPIFLGKSDGVNAGTFEVKNIGVMPVEQFSKIEGSMLLSSSINQNFINAGNSNNSVYRVYNEAYNPLWKYSNAEKSPTYTINLMHNGFIVDSDEDGGKYHLLSLVENAYKYSMVLSILCYFVAFLFFILKTEEINDG